MNTRNESGGPFATAEGEKPFIERIRILEVENASLRGQVQVMAVELSMVANWIKQNGGGDLFNQESEVYKNCHPKSKKSAEIEKDLAVTVPSVQEPEVLMNRVSNSINRTDKRGRLLGKGTRHVERQPLHRTMLNSSTTSSTQNNGSKEKAPVTVPLPPKRKTHVCKLCSKAFRKPSDLKNHARTHSKEKPFSCPICDKTFGQTHSLTRHKKIHTKDYPHKCSVCAKPFARADHIRRHLRVHFKPGQCRSLLSLC